MAVLFDADDMALGSAQRGEKGADFAVGLLPLCGEAVGTRCIEGTSTACEAAFE